MLSTLRLASRSYVMLAIFAARAPDGRDRGLGREADLAVVRVDVDVGIGVA